MTQIETITPEQLSVGRRRFLQTALAGAGLLGLSKLAVATTAAAADIPPTQGVRGTASSQRDQDILNFALNLEYLEAEFYLRAATGQGLGGTTGFEDVGSDLGQPGAVSIKPMPKVPFVTKQIEDLANELAQDELAHVRLLRAVTQKSVPRPAINLDTSFTAAARAAKLIGPNQTFDPYANENNFLLAAFIFEDVGVTAYKGAAPLLKSKTILEAAAGILAVEAYHSGAVRTLLASRGTLIANPGSTGELGEVTVARATNAISDLRDSADGSPDLDQGILNPDGTYNIVPTDANGLAFSRTPGQVLGIVYLNPAAESGGFLPNGVNGRIR